jgi:hypothetical protein
MNYKAYSETLLKGDPIMDKLKERFKNDPAFALTVLVIGTGIGIKTLDVLAKNVTAAAYAYRASKM